MISPVVGKLIRVHNRNPGGPPTMVINTVAEGLRDGLTLCHGCKKFHPNKPGHCPIAEEHFQLCNKSHTSSILIHCGQFESDSRAIRINDRTQQRIDHED